MWEQPIGTFPVDFEKQGDEWMHHLAVELTGSHHIGGTGTDGTSPVEIGPPAMGPVTSKLLVSPHQDGLTCAVIGDGAAMSDDQVEPWRRAAEAAVADLGHRNHDFAWEALVGAHPHLDLLQFLGVLRTPAKIGPVRLTPGGVCMQEYLTGQSHLVDQPGCLVRHSCPVVASGQVSTYDWDQVVPLAQYCLRRVCAVLTLCPGGLWIPRSRPRQLIDGHDGLKVPATSPFPPSSHLPPEVHGWSGTVPADLPSIELPDWMESAWASLDADQGLATAVNAYYEARLLEQEHPSVAFATYVAAIEGFGARFVPEDRCDCCAECAQLKPFAHKRFRKALKTVMTNRELREFEIDYALRSSIAHSGTLFSSEHIFGYPLMRLFQQTSDLVFDYGLLTSLRSASRRVLMKALEEACTREEHDADA
jgi:hypothetical protein